MKRRDFIKGAAAIPAAVALPSIPAASPTPLAQNALVIAGITKRGTRSIRVVRSTQMLGLADIQRESEDFDTILEASFWPDRLVKTKEQCDKITEHIFDYWDHLKETALNDPIQRSS